MSSKRSGVKNLKAFQSKLQKRTEHAEKHIMHLVQRSATLVENEAKNSMNEAKSGRTYTIRGKPHTASAEGEAPAVVTGMLRTSITSNVKKSGQQVIGQIIANSFDNTDYAVHLEFGTSKMRPRPFMQPALEKQRPAIKRLFKKGGYLE